MDVRFKKINKVADLDEFENSWKELEQGFEMTAFQSFEWNKLLVEEAINDKANILLRDIYVCYLEDENQIQLILPIITQKISNKIKWIGRKKGIYILGYGSYSDYLNAIYRDIDLEKVMFMISSLQAKFSRKKIYFHNIRKNSFNKYLSEIGMKIDESIAVSVNIVESVDDYNKLLSKSTKQNLRTALNRMNKKAVDYHFEITGVIDDVALKDKLLDLHIKRSKVKNLKNLTGLKKLSSTIRFWTIRHKERNNNIIYRSMGTMENSFTLIVFLEGNVVGYLYGLKENNCVRIMQNCFDMNYNFYSPLFRACYDFILHVTESQEYKEIDFTRGTEEYKYKLAGHEVVIENFVI